MKWKRYAYKCILVWVYNARFSWNIWMKLKFSRQIFETCSNIIFHVSIQWEPSVVPCWLTDVQTWRKLIVAFRHHHISVMELGHLLTRSGLTYSEVFAKVCHDFLCQLENSVSLPWVICYEAFYLHVVFSFSFTPVICQKLVILRKSLKKESRLCAECTTRTGKK
jgi:hypothetical protein